MHGIFLTIEPPFQFAYCGCEGPLFPLTPRRQHAMQSQMPKVVPTVLCAILLAFGLPLRADDSIYERDPINYEVAPANDPVAKLSQKIASGQVKLAYDAERGYLPALLKALDVPVSSQSLVF